MIKISLIELLARKVFNYYFPHEKVIYNWRPDFLLNKDTGKNLELDIWYPEINLAVEINGVYHLDKNQRLRDLLKKKLCYKNNIRLIQINSADDLLFVYRVINKCELPEKIFVLIQNYKKRKSKKYKLLERKFKGKKIFHSQVQGESKFIKYKNKQEEERIFNLNRYLASGRITLKEYEEKLSANTLF